ncbi:hypothetical protein [Kribbella sp. NPDC051718]|uniref:hypothetical protein n=1 Tax=Kribbella sp. NPDC051718 TaxID=3155168 RepID=UPI00342E5431
MTVYPGQPAGPQRKTLLWLAIGCFVAGLALTGLFVNRVVHTLPQEPQWADSGTVHLDQVGLTVYSSIPVLRAPCDVRDSNGTVLELVPPAQAETFTVDDDTWYVVARSRDRVPPGDYIATCTDKETSAVYALGPRSTPTGFAYAVLGAITSFLVGTLLAIVFLILFFLRRRASADRTAPGSAATSHVPWLLARGRLSSLRQCPALVRCAGTGRRLHRIATAGRRRQA